jgi:hypothetical protein
MFGSIDFGGDILALMVLCADMVRR